MTRIRTGIDHTIVGMEEPGRPVTDGEWRGGCGGFETPPVVEIAGIAAAHVSILHAVDAVEREIKKNT